MSAKSLRNQLLAAIAMVLVATIALGSSTYAWFVTNSTVTAEGMNVQATAENGIEIQEVTTNSTWASTAAGIHSTAVALVPTSTTDAATWYHASAIAKNASTVDTDTIETLTLAAENTTGNVGKIAASDTQGYYIHDQFKIRATNSAASDLKVSNVTVTGSDNLTPGLRVLVKCGDKTFICAPVEDATVSYQVGTARTEVTAKTAAELYAETLSASVDTTGIPVDVFVYFEGEDEAIYTDHIPDQLQNLSITLDFTATV